jgi:hypothetical protein
MNSRMQKGRQYGGSADPLEKKGEKEGDRGGITFSSKKVAKRKDLPE